MADEFDREVVVHVLRECGGNIAATADKLGVKYDALRNYLHTDEELSRVFLPVEPKEDLTEEEELDRPPPASLTKTHADLISAKTVDFDQLSKDLIAAGHDPNIIARLESIGGFEKNAGVFLAGSLNLMYKMVVDSGMSLYEHLEFIKNKLNDQNLKDKERVFWQRAYNTTVDQLGKSYDRVLQGTG